MDLNRRSLLIGAGAAGALMIGWALWPRSYPPNLVANEGETVFNAWLKIGSDGQIVVAVPEIEMGQGSFTLIPQIVADELGADWRTIGVEPAPINPAYADPVFSKSWASGRIGADPAQVSDGSATVAAFEAMARQAGAAARILLCQAAAARWDADWRACDTEAGFVVRGNDRLRFGVLAKEAVGFDLPDDLPLRASGSNRLTGRGMNRLDIPAKIDGTALYAADIRLPDMVFAAVRQGPIGDSLFKAADRAAADRIPGVLQIVEHDCWVAAVGSNWWAANRALDAMRPRFETRTVLPEGRDVMTRLGAALDRPGKRFAELGEIDEVLGGGQRVSADYAVGPAAHAAIEPFAATAAIRDGKLELWIATQLPVQARNAAATAIGFDERDVILHPVLSGGSFGRRFETEICAQAAILALKLKRPVQLLWSRAEDTMQDRFRPPARARMTARLGRAGRIEGWHARIAAPDGIGEAYARSVDGMMPHAALAHAAEDAQARAVDGAIPPYGVGVFAVDHHVVDTGIPSGKWRSDAHSYTAFFNESFVDELARTSGVEPFSFRMALLGGNPRLALCLSKAATKGGWEGGAQGTGQGLACHAMGDAYIAVLAEAAMGDDQRIRVSRLVAVADVGRVTNPDIARQQVEGGLLFGVAMATGNAITVERGVAGPKRFGSLGLPRLADMPEMSVELIVNNEVPGRVGEIGVPPVAPAIANALFAGSGRRFRTLPLAPANG